MRSANGLAFQDAPIMCIARVLTILGILFASQRAVAGDLTGEEVATRRQLIDQAQAAASQGNHSGALDLARKAGQLQMSVSLERFIAEEELAVGDTAAALGTAEVCSREARAAGSSANDHATACDAIIERAKPGVGYVIVTVKTDVPGVAVIIAGKAIPSTLVGQRYVVTPGDVTIAATADGYKSAAEVVHVGAQEVKEVTLEMTPLPSPPPVRRHHPPEKTFSLSPLVPVGASLAGASSLVALGVGVSGKVALDDYVSRCTVKGALPTCGAEQMHLTKDLKGRAIAVNVSLAVAGVGLVIGTIGMVLSAHSSNAASSALYRGEVVF